MVMRNTVLIALLFTAGCSTAPQSDDEFWYKQGYRLGSNGYSYQSQALTEIQQAQTKRSFIETDYRQGYQEGKAVYCDPFKAFDKGRAGVRYIGQCAGAENETMLRAEWERGWQAFIGMDFEFHP